MRDPEPLDPAQPEPDPDRTQRLPTGVPLDPGRTLRLPLTALDASPDRTQKLVLPLVDEPPIRVQRVDQPAEAAGQTQQRSPGPEVPRSLGWRLPLGVGAAVVLLAGAGLVYFRRSAAQPVTPPVTAGPESPAPGSLPPVVLATLERANAGDVHAMRELGAWYYNGLMVPRDREKGLAWYRKAAAAGSKAARSELSTLESGR